MSNMKNKQDLLEKLPNLFLDPLYTKKVCQVCRSVILDIVARARETSETPHQHWDHNNRKFCQALSIAVTLCPDLQGYTLSYLRQCGLNLPSAVKSTGKMMAESEKQQVEELAEMIWRFVHVLGRRMAVHVPLDVLMTYLGQYSDQARIVWLCADSVAVLLGMTSGQRDALVSSTLQTEEEGVLSTLKLQHINWCQKCGLSDPLMEDHSVALPLEIPEQNLTEVIQGLDQADLHHSVVLVSGILLPRIRSTDDKPCSTTLVPAESLDNNLRSLALAVSAGSPVLLQGPVGSGKTSVVEHLAHLTGRVKSPHLMKIQLGDQTDSKALLGTYRCTDIPGEFVWQAGVLTRAVMEGHWVLLEDIDSAPMDVISVLLPLLERHVLSVPGHGDNIPAAPGFQLFATQRLLGSGSGWHRQHSSSSVLLEKMWTKVNVEPLSRSELEKVINTLYPHLCPVTEKLLDIYFMLSAGKHELGVEDKLSDEVGKFLSHDGRLISTRDLMNWCRRVAPDFNVSSTATANHVLQEALDCFAACLPKPSKRVLVAEAIGAKLNISKVMAEYFCCKYKPEVKVTSTNFTCGRVQLDKKAVEIGSILRAHQNTFSYTRQASALLEQVSVCVGKNEPVLLVGETGTGKTSSVQYLAEQLGHTLKVINMNQQSDSSDLLGGFKPVDMRHVIRPFREDFEILFCSTFSRKENSKFLNHIQDCFAKQKWEIMLTLMEHTLNPAIQRCKTGKEKNQEKYEKWLQIRRRLQQLKVQIKQKENVLAFAFIEGSLVRAVRNGDWVLLDEINLAAAETLECLSGLLESTIGSVILTERGDVEQVVRHPDFRLFACMNPATDVGKKELPTGIRNRFTELYVDEAEESQDLKILVSDYLKGLSLSSVQLDGIVKFYLIIREQAAKHLTDGTGHKPHFSLRTLCRALRYSSRNPCGLVLRSLYEGFCLSFLTQLDRTSHPLVQKLVCRHILGKTNINSILKKDIPMPGDGKYEFVEGYWIPVGAAKPVQEDKYILTASVRANLKDLSRVVSAGQHPVLIQGETSVGKTSLVTWLAQTTGNVCVRVNNHEHTDLQEYIGSYSADQHGKLVFQEGVLVEAMRKGHWIILDELNLAPTDVLEALNRLLDDNRELFIAETQDTVKAHPKFMLFATQNPPGHYGGRKMLSRAFRNRFVELHFDQIPSKELETILHQRCDLPLSYSKRLVSTMLDLQTRRRGSGVFAGKQGYMTLRDLFRWAERYKCKNVNQKQQTFYDWDQHMADHGYMLLAGRVRRPEEVTLVLEVIQKHLKRPVDPDKLFTLGPDTSPTTVKLLKEVTQQTVSEFGHIVWTYNMRRLAVLIGQAIQFNEPVLLVGDTGCGKTTVCQLYAALKNTRLHNINCHLHTESADFLGGLRPCRSHDQNQGEGELKLFEWVDGPLVISMKEGSMFLVDEISLADDSVLERLNSVLEPERTLLLAEKGGGNSHHDEVDNVVAKDGFQIFATMNPGGDFGKKELSPALRNRFTEIWCAQTDQCQDLVDIIEHNLRSGIHLCNQEDGTSGFGRAIMDFVHWFSNNDIAKRCTVSIRDILSWVHFINTCSRTLDEEGMDTDDHCYNKLDPALAFIHGACLVFLDGLGSGTTSRGNDTEVRHIRDTSLKFLLQLVNHMTHQVYRLSTLGLIDDMSQSGDSTGHSDLNTVVQQTDRQFCIYPFAISRGLKNYEAGDGYALQAPTTCVNAQRILRALQLTRPLLLEGSPGVGKTSLVAAIAKAAGQELVRINLSEQTDVTDLFGADLPVEGQEGGVFAWRDGPLLQALKAGHWIVLDELNLASQSVLEGLNACLDHRAEVYVPELGQTFHIQHYKTRLFACQNPLNQGGGRKGLPRSFLNRFTQVYIEPLTMADLTFISRTMYPNIPKDLLNDMVKFNMQIHDDVTVNKSWGQKGSPWEFNLRDLFRWCDLLCQNQVVSSYNPGEFVGLLYRERLRTLQDKDQVKELYERIFPEALQFYTPSRHVTISGSVIQAGHSFLRCEEYVSRETTRSLYLLHHLLEPIEAVMKCVEMNWMSILVGPQSCGKTSLVQLLSSLTGHHLHVLAMNSSMDTTELLGGFEQADIQNHVERLTSTTESIVSEVTILLLQDQHVGTAGRLQQSWNSFSQSRDTESGKKLSSVEELESVKVKVTRLTEVISVIKQSLQTQTSDRGAEFLKTVTALESEVMKVTSKLTLTSVGSGGGAFEWVDSVLVQALQSGHWLLIDNVNFCSASVLDRLNALLEPNGVLTINERGVIDGAIPSIKPHPNFRLFLAMDPKFGEISRAMRNRGVEIFIPGEEDGSPYSSHDVKVMLQGQGLLDIEACDWLMSLHSVMRENISLGERPVILNLIHAAMVTQQQRDRGISLVKALIHGSCDVYVKNVRSLVTRKLAGELWEEHCRLLGNLSSDSTLQVTRTISTKDFHDDKQLSNVKIHGQTFLTVLRSCIDLLKRSKLSELKSKMQELWHAVILFLNLSSRPYRKLHFDWLISTIKRVWPDRNSLNKDELSALEMHIERLVEGLQSVMTGAIDSVLPQYDQKDLLSCNIADLVISGPVDVRWNPQALQKFLLSCQQPSEYIIKFNRYHMMQAAVIKLNSASDENLLERLKSFTNKSGLGRRDHSELCDIYTLLSQKDELLKAIASLQLSDYRDVVKVLDAVKWRCRLLEACEGSMTGEEMEYHYMALHWHMFYKRTWLLLQDSLPQHLHSVVSHLHPSFVHNDKQFVHFWKSVGHPAPFRTQEEAAMTLTLNNLCRAVDLEVDSVAIVTRKKVKLLLCDGGQTMEMLHTAMAGLHQDQQGNNDEFQKLVKQIQDTLKKYGLDQKIDSDLTTTVTQSQSENVDTTSPWQHVCLWPLFEYVTLVAEVTLVPDLYNHNLLGGCRDLTDFSLTFTPVSPAQVTQYRELGHTDLQQHNSMILYKQLFNKTWNCTATKQIDTWLHWSEEEDVDTVSQLEDKGYGPYAFHMATPTYAVFTFLCGGREDNKRSIGSAPSDLQCLQVSLGQCQAQSQKLSLVAKHLWSHGSLLSSQQFSPRFLEKQHLHEAFTLFLKSATAVVSPDKLEVYKELFSEIQAMMTEVKGQDVKEKVGCDLVLDTKLRSRLDTCQSYLTESLPDLAYSIQRCFCIVYKVFGTDPVSLVDVGTAWLHLGLLQRALLVPNISVDPVEKVAIKLSYARQELADTQMELSVYDQHHRFTTGQLLSSLPDHLLHPCIPHLVAKTRYLQENVTQLEQQQAYRPKPSKFKFLVSDVKDYLSSVGSEDHILQLLGKLTSTTIGNKFAEERMWQKTQGSFLDNLDTRYPEYRDLVTPFSVTIAQVRHGLRLVAGSAQQQQVRRQLIGQKGNLEEKLLLMAKFPTISKSYPSNLDLVKSLVSDLTSNLLLTVIQRKDMQETNYQQEKQLISRLLHASLDLVKSDSLVRKELTSDMTFTLSMLFHQFVTAWQKQEEAKRQREKEEESLYRYKSKVHGDDRDIEVIEEEEFRNNFPTFVSEFVDITGTDTLDEPEEMETEDKTRRSDQEETTPDMITEDEMYHVYQTHHHIFTCLCQAIWLPRLHVSSVDTTDLVAPSLSTYYVGSVIATQTYDILSNEVDPQIMGGHLLASRLIQEQITPPVAHGNELEPVKGNPTFDIYHDPYVAEVVQCRPVLDRLTARVQELLSEWPDHPTLKQLMKIMERILDFPVTCPIMKFLTGLELLLEKAQEWESNAARHVSIATQLADVSLLIMQWRKLELSCWSQCLESIRKKHKCHASRWWFHLYQLIQAFLQNSSQVPETDNTSISQAEGEDGNQEEILKSLKQFMEIATLGDYSVRLGMLKAFHCQLVVMETSPKQATLMSFLWNLHQFYDQFTDGVQKELDKLMSPVLKELKGFVKIARWTDMNYWALKQTTEKTHRTLHKHMKSFKGILEVQVRGILKEGGADTITHSSSWLTELAEAVSSIRFTSVLKNTNIPSFLSEDLFPLQCRLLALCHRAGKHLTKYTATTGYTDHITTMDEATGEIIETIHELQSLEVDQSAEKEKQRSEAKHIHQKKRKALADLFKHLAFIGLSYRKGLVLMNKTDGQNEALLVPPVNVSALVQQTAHIQSGEAMSTLGDGCGLYFNKCIARKVRFMAALQTPSSELGVGNIDRCKGFTEHLFDLLVRQYQSLASISESYCHLSKLTRVLTRLEEELSHPQPPVQQLTTWVERIKVMLVTLLEGMAQFEALLNCCPSSGNGPAPHPSPFPASKLSQMALVCHGDQIWSDTSDKVKKIQANVKTIQSKLLNVTDSEDILLWGDVEVISHLLCDLERMVPDLDSIVSGFRSPDSSHQSAFTDTLFYLRGHITDTVSQFQNWRSQALKKTTTIQVTMETHLFKEFGAKVESLITSLLLVIQNLSKLALPEDGNTGEEKEDKSQQGHFVKFLCDRVEQERVIITSDKIRTDLKDLLDQLTLMWNSETGRACSTPCGQMLVHCLPLIHHYLSVVQFNFLQQLAVTRTTGKLLSTLLEVFTELSTNGFCLPAEFAEDIAGEGATDFVDIEGGGMGEGEGAKDVSDQIETEDQLEDTRQQNEKKEPENHPDVASEENAIEMSEDFDANAQDLEDVDKRSDGEEEDGKDDEDKLDKQMGEVDEQDADKLDDQMWGSDDDQDDDENKEDKKEESGPGAGQEAESQMVAKDDNTDKGEGEDKEEEKKDEDQTEENPDVKPHQQQEIDESEYDDDRIDPHHGNKEQEEQPETMDLPEDLNLDENEGEEKADGLGPESDTGESQNNQQQVKQQTGPRVRQVGESKRPAKVRQQQNRGQVRVKTTATGKQQTGQEQAVRVKTTRKQVKQQTDQVRKGESQNEQQQAQSQAGESQNKPTTVKNNKQAQSQKAREQTNNKQSKNNKQTQSQAGESQKRPQTGKTTK
ncbi:midasin-like [Argopecten irradians]|uniref:midasin-like n=1 Tax=Argopecten irradians TaxID=31199 RepID=UPI0037185519